MKKSYTSPHTFVVVVVDNNCIKLKLKFQQLIINQHNIQKGKGIKRT